VFSTAACTLGRHPSFLRLLIVFAAQPPAAAGGELQAVVAHVRELALEPLAPAIVAARPAALSSGHEETGRNWAASPSAARSTGRTFGATRPTPAPERDRRPPSLRRTP
jgi:hypothetical protein